ncbi:uncharacterized protein LOC126656607 [Mercurialis annua]|uniref:uncharacterized protein LOC126656607 n=1 Tax=Mercurialis annua TaxID=3986 RepID=UPI00216003B8|nr:uncharacterized protein LOC126656607 [Mercurialis annua]
MQLATQTLLSINANLEAMKVLSENAKKNHFLKLEKRNPAVEYSAITLGNVKSRASFNCCCGLHVLRRILWKLRTQLKQSLGWRQSSIQYSYDIHSYSLNFDDGRYHVDGPSKGFQ